MGVLPTTSKAKFVDSVSPMSEEMKAFLDAVGEYQHAKAHEHTMFSDESARPSIDDAVEKANDAFSTLVKLHTGGVF